MLLTQKFRPMNLVVFYQILETFIMPAVAPWATISVIIQAFRQLLSTQAVGEFDGVAVGLNLITNVSIVSSVGYFMYEYFKRKSNTLYYNL